MRSKPIPSGILEARRAKANVLANGGYESGEIILDLLDEIDRLKLAFVPRPPGAEPVGGYQYVRAIHRCHQARNLISVLSQHVTDDHTREEIRKWMAGEAPGEITPAPAPHQRAALGELGREHGLRHRRGDETADYRATGCDCDYCSAFAVALVEHDTALVAAMYPSDWPKCPSCGEPALDGHITCGKLKCDERGERYRQHCDHKFVDSKNCLKCGVSIEALRGGAL